jgi:hypothetical protein
MHVWSPASRQAQPNPSNPHLSTHGYIQCANTPSLFRHVTRDIIFSLVIDDFGVHYTDQADAEHLIKTLESNAYKLKVRSLGEAYLGMSVTFNRVLETVCCLCLVMLPKCYNDFDLSTYSLATTRLEHLKDISHHPTRPRIQVTFIDKTEKLNPTLITELQAIIGMLLYYARAVDPTLLTISNELASQQAQPTQRILKAANRALIKLLCRTSPQRPCLPRLRHDATRLRRRVLSVDLTHDSSPELFSFLAASMTPPGSTNPFSHWV